MTHRRTLRRDALDGAGVLAGEQGDFAAARAQFEAMLALAREHGTPARVARAYSNLGNLALYEGETDEAIRLYEESTALWRGTDDDRGLSVITQNLGIAHSGAGNHERAVELLEESVVLARRAGDPAHVSSALRSLGRASLAARRGRLAIVKEALELSWEVRDRPGIVECLETVATVVEPESGAELIGAAEAIREAAGAARQPDEEAWVAEAMTTLRAALGEAALAAAVQRGRNLTLTAAVTRADSRRHAVSGLPLAAHVMPLSIQRRTGTGRKASSRREVDSARLAAIRTISIRPPAAAKVRARRTRRPARRRRARRRRSPRPRPSRGRRRRGRGGARGPCAGAARGR